MIIKESGFRNLIFSPAFPSAFFGEDKGEKNSAKLIERMLTYSES